MMVKAIWTLLIILSLPASMSLRLQEVPREPAQLGIQRTLASFLMHQGPTRPQRISYAQDGSIQGMQLRLPRCNGALQIAALSPGSEMHGVFERRARAADYQLVYLFDGRLYDDFVSVPFWSETLRRRLAFRLGLSRTAGPGPVLAITHPKACPTVQALPWHRLSFHH